MADVFISYARPNAATAARIADELRTLGYSVWYDQHLPAHRSYADVIEEQLAAAAAVIVLWSADSAASQWVRSEANRARESGRLVQVCLDDSALPMPFDQIQCADLRKWRGNCAAPGWQTVEASVADLLGRASEEATPAGRPVAVNRRRLLASGALIVAAGTGWWWTTREPPLSEEARLLLQKGMDALQANDALDPEDEGTTAQAIALLTEATRAAPQSAEAWGGLALAYAARRRAVAVDERAGLKARGEQAAAKALAIDQNEPRALAAQRLMAPLYRHWAAAEQADRRALSHNPRFPILLFVLSDMLGSVGRYREATDLSNRLDRSKFLLPGAERKAIINLWASGDWQAADDALRVAAERWPRHRQIWRTQLAYLLYSGRPDKALELLRDDRLLPSDIPRDLVAAATATAQGLAGQVAPGTAVSRNLDFLRSSPSFAMPVAQAAAALGDHGGALSILDGYYFGQGPWAAVAPPGGDADRLTAPLFQPPMKDLWRTPHFATLLRRIGLEAYWRQSRTLPDFRRPA